MMERKAYTAFGETGRHRRWWATSHSPLVFALNVVDAPSFENNDFDKYPLISPHS